MNASRQVLAAFSEEQTEHLTGVSKAQLRYWDRTAFYRPTYVEENRRVAFSRIYSFKDIVALRVLHVMRNQYKISLQHLRDVSRKFGSLAANPDGWIKTKLYPLNGRVVWHEEGSALPQVVTSGQYVASVVLDDVVQDTKAAVERIPASRDPAKIGTVEKSRYVVHNAAVIGGTRIPVGAIKRFAKAGYTTEQILAEYPDLTEADVKAAIAYRESSAAA